MRSCAVRMTGHEVADPALDDGICLSTVAAMSTGSRTFGETDPRAPRQKRPRDVRVPRRVGDIAATPNVSGRGVLGARASI